MTEQAESVRIIIEVVAGLLPGKDPDPKFTRTWAITSKEWYESAESDRADPEGSAVAELLISRNAQAVGYASYLILQPDRLNWVRVDWIYL